MGTLDEAFEQADANLNKEDSNEEVSEVEETKETEPEESQEAEDNSESEEKPESKDSDDSFTKFNPEELPEELKGVYKSLQADYTRKTQEAAKIRKESQERIEKLEKKLEELGTNEEPSKPQQETEEDKMRNVVRSEIEAERAKEYQELALSDYESADSRLVKDSDDYDEATDLYVGQKMDGKLQEHLESGEPIYTFDHKKALKKVLGDWDEYVKSKNKAFLESQQKQAKSKADEVNKQNPKAKSGVSKPKKPTLDEAIALAQQKA